jgi:hypothetical protein
MEKYKMIKQTMAGACFLLGLTAFLPSITTAQNQEGLGALAPANLNKPRPAAPFNVTGAWSFDRNFSGERFDPPEGFVLTPYGQTHFDAAKKATEEGKVYRNDIGLCWPIGMPIMMARAWPVHMIQTPTSIFMVQELMNEIRMVFMDGREHTDFDVAVPSWAGESIGHWEDGTLVIDTRNFVDQRHWIHDRMGIPGSDQLQIIERITMPDQDTLRIEFTLRDPKVFVGDWVITKQLKRSVDRDLQEVHCLPDLNEHMPTTQAEEFNVR